ncbi:MAG: AAA family ATPase [Bacteroidales bacterium]|nr:AAA family ATPase [Bacteroidales bacterium]
MDRLYQQVKEMILSHFPHVPTEGQSEACSMLVRFLYDGDPCATAMLRGYAGTGKTSLISALIQTAPALNLKTLLLAPTGRAAKVLSGYSGQTAYTIHKKIYITVTDQSGMTHTIRARNKHAYTLFIIDEASMIDDGLSPTSGPTSLLQDLIDYVREGESCRMLLVGDAAQLPPVGSDISPALDSDYLRTLAPLKIFEATLTEVVRQQQQSGILLNATQLRQQITTMDDYDQPQLPLFSTAGYADIVRLAGGDLEETLYREYEQHGHEEVAIVCRSNKRANLYNQAIRNRVLFREEEINAGDMLMVVKNNYYWVEEESPMGFIANGDIVEVLSVRNHQELYGFHFVDASLRFVDYPDAPTLDCKLLLETLHSESPSLTAAESQQLYESVMEDYADLPTKRDRMAELKKNPYYNALQVKFSYALTCHKTQGGQWCTVFVEQGFLTDELLNREYLRWLYTALTRATDRIYLIGFEDRFFADIGEK